MTNENTTVPGSLPEHDNHGRCRMLGQILDRIGNKWTIMIVGALSEGPVRFNALQRIVEGVSHRMLTLTLRGLEADGLVVRTVYPTVPPRVEYELTDMGRSLIEPLKALLAWAESHQPAISEAQAAISPDIRPRSGMIVRSGQPVSQP